MEMKNIVLRVKVLFKSGETADLQFPLLDGTRGDELVAAVVEFKELFDKAYSEGKNANISHILGCEAFSLNVQSTAMASVYVTVDGAVFTGDK